jgi:hypothetical protein
MLLAGPVFGPGTQTLPGSRNYTGTVTFSVVITSPAGCPGITLPVTLPDCFVCPSITWDPPVKSATCDAALNRSVMVTAHATSPSPSSFTAALRNAGTTLDTKTGSGSLTLSGMGSYPGGSMQTFEVVITSDSTCGSSSIKVNVDSCCPSIMFSQQFHDCVNSDRSVTVRADLSFPSAYAAELHGPPSGLLDMLPVGSGTRTLQHTGNYPGGSSQTFSVVTTSPASCPDQSHIVNVPSCDKNGGFNLCAGLLVSAITLLVLGAALIIIGVCFSVPPLVIAGLIAAVIGLLLFVLWVALCVRFTPCSVMQTVHCILFFLIAVIAPIIALLAYLFGGLPCLLVVLGAWGGWGTIYAWLGVAMGSVGCTKKC